MTPLDTSDQGWFKSSRSANNAACVEVRFGDGSVGVRDSKDRTGPVLAFGQHAWATFVTELRDGVSPQP